MPSRKGNRQKQRHPKIPYFQHAEDEFDLQKYLDNPPLIEGLSKELTFAISHIERLQLFVENMETDKHKLELLNQKMDLELNEYTKRIEEYDDDKIKLHNELKVSSSRLETLKEDNIKLEMKSKVLEIKLEEINRNSFFIYIMTFISGFALTLGGNLIVASPGVWQGWVFAVLGFILGIVVFFMSRRASKGKV